MLCMGGGALLHTVAENGVGWRGCGEVKFGNFLASVDLFGEFYKFLGHRCALISGW